MPLNTKEIRDLVSKNRLKEAIKQVEEYTQALSDTHFNDIITAISQKYEGNERSNLLNTISYNTYIRERSKTTVSLLGLLTKMDEYQEEQTRTSSNHVSIDGDNNIVIQGSNNNHITIGTENESDVDDNEIVSGNNGGYLLYSIPNEMTLNVLYKCIIRISILKEKLLKDFFVETVRIKNIEKVSDVMEVDLINMGNKNFLIEKPNSKDQIVDGETCTEWIFYVTPIKLGLHKLILKISTVAFINNKERKKEILLEESVNILTIELYDDNPPNFKIVEGLIIGDENPPVSPTTSEQDLLTVPHFDTLTGQQLEQFTDALISAYRNRLALERFCRYKLDKNLNTITGNNNLNDVVFQLVEYFEANGQLHQLVEEAYKDKPNSPLLKQFVESLS